MSKLSLIALAASLSVSMSGAALAFSFNQEPEGTSVEIWGRTWLVTPVEETPNTYWAQRDNNNNNPFGRPARMRSHQAIRAISSATGCSVVTKSMIETISGRFRAQVRCSK